MSTELPREAEYRACGSLWVAADEEGFAEVKSKYGFYSQHDIPVEILDSRQLPEAEPNLRSGMAGALLMPADNVCYPPSAAAYLVARVCRAGGELFLGTQVVQMSDSGVESQAGQHIRARIIILATGAMIGELIPDQHILSRMLKRAIEYMPRFAELSAIRTWTGFRAATLDKLPLIGRCPGYEHVYLATGNEGLGITTSMATAQLLADEILGRSSAISREPYQPSRSFAVHV